MWQISSLRNTFRPASFGLPSVSCIAGNESTINAWTYGELEFCDGRLISIRPRWWPRIGSTWESMQDSYLRNVPNKVLIAYYAFPLRSPGFMSVLYAHSGPETQYKTILRAVLTVDEIARLRNAQAIVCQTVSARATERLMSRWGYVRHAITLGNNHFIKRLR